MQSKQGHSCSHLPCRVNDIAIVFDAIMLDALLESGFYCRVVGFNKVILDELDDQGRFSWEVGALQFSLLSNLHRMT